LAVKKYRIADITERSNKQNMESTLYVLLIQNRDKIYHKIILKMLPETY